MEEGEVRVPPQSQCAAARSGSQSQRAQREPEARFLNQEYDPTNVQFISTKPLSAKASEYKSIIITKIAKCLEDNKNWNLSIMSAIQISKRIIDKMYNHLDNSDKVMIQGDKLLSLFKKLAAYEKICKQLAIDGFRFTDLLALGERAEQLAQINARTTIKIDEFENDDVIRKKSKTATATTITAPGNEVLTAITNNKKNNFFEQKAHPSQLSKPAAEDREVDTLVKQSKQARFQLEEFNKNYEKICQENSGEKPSHKQADRSTQLKEKNKQRRDGSQKAIASPQADASANMLPVPLAKAQGAYEKPDMRYLRIYEGNLDCQERIINQVSILSSQSFEKLSQMPVSKGSQLKMGNTVYFNKFAEYINFLLKGKSMSTLLTFGWVESLLMSHNEALQMLGRKLRNQSKVGVIEWNDNCKIYLFNKEQISHKWTKKLFSTTDNSYMYDTNLYWISVTKRSSSSNLKQLIPTILPKVENKSTRRPTPALDQQPQPRSQRAEEPQQSSMQETMPEQDPAPCNQQYHQNQQSQYYLQSQQSQQNQHYLQRQQSQQNQHHLQSQQNHQYPFTQRRNGQGRNYFSQLPGQTHGYRQSSPQGTDSRFYYQVGNGQPRVSSPEQFNSNAVVNANMMQSTNNPSYQRNGFKSVQKFNHSYQNAYGSKFSTAKWGPRNNNYRNNNNARYNNTGLNARLSNEMQANNYTANSFNNSNFQPNRFQARKSSF